MTTVDMSGQVLTDLRFDYSVVLSFTGGYVVLVASPFMLNTPGAAHDFTPDLDPPEGLAPMNNLLGQRIFATEIGANGSLSMTFDDGSRLCVPPDANYEAWNLSGPGGLFVVCMPGGALETWSGIAPER
ncbi:DUF6188 family protein [Mycobacterium sp. SMC-13]|uniref:DUF6188 family protein n=1 Tax=Mycobacterium sp. SMC-13 TaxID=3381626 RepID=UPI0038769A1D